MPLRTAVGRFIPAGAGNGRNWAVLEATPAVHPRWRGERDSSGLCEVLKDGSSPLARGTVGLANPTFIFHRFIPAGAGNGNIIRIDGVNMAVHPRWRGERVLSSLVLSCFVGSSPLARGTVAQTVQIAVIRRFIPAGAGNGNLSILA